MKNEVEVVNIKNLIYEINNQYVILISDIALLYGLETKRVNEIIRRNKSKYDEFNYFMLDDTEYQNLIDQIEKMKKGTLEEEQDTILLYSQRMDLGHFYLFINRRKTSK